MDESRLLLQVSVALAIALGAGWLATRLGLSTIVGYVVAGMLISPFTPGFGADVDRLQLLADVGIVLLLFAVGVQFSLGDLLRAGPKIVIGALLQVVGMMILIALFGALVGWSRNESLYIGAAAGMTSSVVMSKLLDARGDLSAEWGRSSLAWSIVQDLSGVVLIVVLAALTGDEGGSPVRDVTWAALKAALFIAGVFALGLTVIPYILGRVAEEQSRELFFLAIATLAIGTALMSEYAGLSLALGAFLAGMVVSASDLSHRVLGELLPTRDVFAVLFFVSAGMLVDPAHVRDEWMLLVLTIVCIVVLKPIVVYVLLRPSGWQREPSMLASVTLIPAAEFSFLLARSGLDEGAISEGVFASILTASAISIVLSPIALDGVYAAVARMGRTIAGPAEDTAPARLGRHAVVVGYGRSGRTVASILGNRFEVVVVEEDARLAREAAESGFEVIEGNPGSPAIVERMRLHDARLLIITLRDAFTTRSLTERARAVNPYLDIIGQAIAASEVPRLRKSGISSAIVAEDEAAYELARYGLHRFGVSSQESLAIVQRERARSTLD